MSATDPNSGPMNRVVAHLIGWASLALGGALIAMVVLVPPYLELDYARWERDWIQACSRTQQQQVEAYEQFASALASNDPVLLQRLAHHHLRLKPSHSQLVDLPEDQQHIAAAISSDPATEATLEHRKAPLIEQWLHKDYPVVGVDHPAYEPPDHTLIRLATGPKRLVLLALGGVFLLCGLLMPGQAVARPQAAEDDGDDHDDDDDDDGEFVTAEIDEEDDTADLPERRAA